MIHICFFLYLQERNINQKWRLLWATFTKVTLDQLGPIMTVPRSWKDWGAPDSLCKYAYTSLACSLYFSFSILGGGNPNTPSPPTPCKHKRRQNSHTVWFQNAVCMESSFPTGHWLVCDGGLLYLQMLCISLLHLTWKNKTVWKETLWKLFPDPSVMGPVVSLPLKICVSPNPSM